jgi:hypoxanthine phosphoribosyltransferase
MQPEKVYVSWKDLEEFIDSLIEEMNKQNFKPTGVYGIPRGGLIPATLISYKLDIHLLMNASKGCLIVDDIADSGRTLLHFTENDTQFNKYFIATMFYHERSIVKPNYYKFMKNDKWIVFPWEE